MTNNSVDKNTGMYKYRFLAHDRTGVGNSLGEEALLIVAPIIDPLLGYAEKVVRRVVGRIDATIGIPISRAEGIDVLKENEVDESGLF